MRNYPGDIECHPPVYNGFRNRRLKLPTNTHQEPTEAALPVLEGFVRPPCTLWYSGRMKRITGKLREKPFKGRAKKKLVVKSVRFIRSKR